MRPTEPPPEAREPLTEAERYRVAKERMEARIATFHELDVWGAMPGESGYYANYQWPKTAAEIEADLPSADKLFAMRKRQLAVQQPAGGDAGERAVCAVCAKELTAGQVSVSHARFNGRLLCPVHQKSEQPVAA
jgi:hypothetical protein